METNIDFNRLLRRGVAEVIVEEELITRLKKGDRLRLKEGFDPSSPDIHLGHMVGLRKLRQFQELGHQVVLIVGDWTAQIGDPSGVSVTRPVLTYEQVKANAETYMQQFFKIVDKSRTEVRWQSEWFGKFSLADVLRLTSRFTIAQFLAREDFNNPDRVHVSITPSLRLGKNRVRHGVRGHRPEIQPAGGPRTAGHGGPAPAAGSYDTPPCGY